MNQCIRGLKTLTWAWLLAIGIGAAQAGHHEEIVAMEAWARPLPPVSKNGAAYLKLINVTEAPRWLVAVSSSAAARVEIHTHDLEQGVARMRRVSEVELPPGAEVSFEPGGLHLMLIGLSETLAEGKSFPVILNFADGSTKEVVVAVTAKSAHSSHGAASHGSEGHQADHQEKHGKATDESHGKMGEHDKEQ